MLIEFSVSNFRSILERQTLSMVASSDTAHRQSNVGSATDESLSCLRSAVIYGPNAAGKSNLLRAVHTLQLMVHASAIALQQGQLLPINPFLFSQKSADRPSEFEIIFVANDGVRYHYCCMVSAQRVFKEWLVAYPRGRAQRWFEREYDPEAQTWHWWFGPNFETDAAESKVWKDFTRENALFLSTAVQLNNAQLRPAFEWMTQQLIVLAPGVEFNPLLSIELLRQSEGQKRLMRFMRAADVGIDRLELEEQEMPSSPAGPVPTDQLRIHFEAGPMLGGKEAPAPRPPKRLRILSWHKTDAGEEVSLDMDDESDGTRKLFEFTGGWLRALDNGATLLVDELDRSLHPHMTRFLIGLFHSAGNAKNAQLIFTTHDTSLLDNTLMRRDQVWFVEKDDKQSSQFYPLLAYSPRKDEALERGYLKGRYGAIPFIGVLGI